VVRARSLVALVASTALLLTGCGAGHPGVAATVGSDQITVKQVDDLAGALCVAGGAGQATIQARNTALDVLIVSQLSNAFGTAQNATYDNARLNTEMTSAASMIQAADESYRPTLSKIIEDYVKGQLMLIDVGGKSLISQGKTPTDTTSQTAGMQLMLAAGIPVTVDPRFGTWKNGSVVIGDGSLSVPVSASAVAAANTSSSGYLASLPAFGKCG
jgi:hypothetical protein